MLREPLTVAAALLLLCVYAGVFLSMPKGAFWSPDEGAKYLEMRSIGWDGGLAYAIPYPGADIDPKYDFYPTACRHEDIYPVAVGDRVRFHWPLWFPLASRLGFSLFGDGGVYLLPILGAWLIACTAGRLIRAHDARLAPAAILIVGLATPVAFYGVTFWEHTLASSLGLLAVCVLIESRPFDLRALAWMAPLLGAAAMLRIEMAAFAVALLLAWYAAGRWSGERLTLPRSWYGRHTAAVAVVSSVSLVVAGFVAFRLLTWRHRWLFGAIPTYLWDDVFKLRHVADALRSILINSPGEQAPVLSRATEWTALAAFCVAASSPIVRWRAVAPLIGIAALFVVLQVCLAVAFLPQPFLSLHGFLTAAPHVVLAAWAAPHVGRRRRHALCAIASAGAAYLAVGFFVIFTFAIERDGTYRTGLEWGTRYLLTLYPILVVLALVGVDMELRSDRALLAKRLLAAVAAGLVLVGVQMQVRGLRMLHASRQTVAEWQEALTGQAPVVTDVWWLPAAVAPFFTRHPMFCVPQIEKLSEWMPRAVERGVHSFTFAGFHPVEPSHADTSGWQAVPRGSRIVAGLNVQEFAIVRSRPPDGRETPTGAPNR